MTESFCKHHGVQAPGKLLNVEGVFDFYKCCLEKVNQPYMMAGPPTPLRNSDLKAGLIKGNQWFRNPCIIRPYFRVGIPAINTTSHDYINANKDSLLQGDLD